MPDFLTGILLAITTLLVVLVWIDLYHLEE
jgi:hypothetical protein